MRERDDELHLIGTESGANDTSDDTGTSVPERRATSRNPYRVRATLETAAIGAGHRDVALWTRDADGAGTGFYAAEGVDEGRRAVLHVPGPDGRRRHIECRVRRSQPVPEAPGWFEGSVEFLGEQPVFSDRKIRAGTKRRTAPPARALF